MMKTFNNAYEFITSQDNPLDYFFKTEDDDYGRFMIINGILKAFVILDDELLKAIVSWNSITDIYKIPSSKEFFNDAYPSVSIQVWSKASIKKYAFVGISNLGVNNPDRSYAINWATNKQVPIQYYNYTLSIPDNNQIIKNADYYIMVPPTDNPYIIGMGLAKQFEIRKNAGKECYIIIDTRIKKIKDIHCLKEGNCQRFAAVEIE